MIKTERFTQEGRRGEPGRPSRLSECVTYIKALAEGIASLAYPPNIYCICCGAVISGEPYGLCGDCQQDFGWASGQACAKCGKPLQAWYSQSLCLDCWQEERFFRKGYCVAQYDDKSKKIVHGLKYGGKGWLGRNIAYMMADRLFAEWSAQAGGRQNSAAPDGWRESGPAAGRAGCTESRYDCIMPVPLHNKKRKKRGYNQAGLIAEELGRLIGVQVDQKTLIRCRPTEVMAKLSGPERRRNLAEAFALTGNRPVGGGRILLVDDVYTTGSTADSCARVLMNAGAASVDVMVFAAGQNTFKNQSQAKL